MKAFIRTMTVSCLALVVPAHSALAQPAPVYQERAAQEGPAPERRPADRPALRQEQLDQMLAPIALHPDPLLSQILMAATYPLEVVQAARWVRANPGLKGEEAVRAVESKEWDPSVKSLVAFPEILAMMDQHLEWTEDLGEAFLAQQAQVMDAIQALRQRAEQAGNLEPNERRLVRREADHIIIDPPAPDVVYVPYYDPRVVYGPWRHRLHVVILIVAAARIEDRSNDARVPVITTVDGLENNTVVPAGIRRRHGLFE